MPFMQVEEVIARLRGLHRSLMECYSMLASARPNDRTALLLESMEEQEREVDRALAEFEQRAGAVVRAAWIQYVADDEARREVEQTTFDASLDAVAIVAGALRLDRAIGHVCESLATGLNATRVSQVFEGVLELERTKARARSQALTQLEDA